MTTELFRRLLAELVGTALLVLFGAGSVVVALRVGHGTLDYPALGLVALAFGLVIAIVIYGFGTTSGAHINPAVSVALAAVRRAPAGWAGLIIGLAVTTDILLIGPVTGGSMNPARTFGPYLANTLFGGSTPWADFGVYVIGPLIGGALAAVGYDLIARPVREVPAEAPQGAEGEIRGRRIRERT